MAVRLGTVMKQVWSRVGSIAIAGIAVAHSEKNAAIERSWAFAKSIAEMA